MDVDKYMRTEQDNMLKPKIKQDVILPYEKQGEYFIAPVEIRHTPLYNAAKRFFDLVFSGIALLLLLLPLSVLAIVVKCTSPGTVFYCQERLGYNGRKFNLIKFRSMCMDAEKNGIQWADEKDDPRVTPIGRFMRKYHIDELPQLWCIFKGDLSLVGPRPERECFYDEFETYIHGFRERLKVKPGLTGLAQINGGYSLKPEEKIQYDVEYMKKRSFWLDLKIIFRTVGVVFLDTGAK